MRRVLAWQGGVASHAELVEAGSRRLLQRAVRAGEITQVARGMFALPEVDAARRAAAELCGAVSHSSAALLYGWELPCQPRGVHVTVPRGRKVSAGRTRAHIHYGQLSPRELERHVTDPVRTILDCARIDTFPVALALAESALRRDDVALDELRAAGARATGPGSRAVRRVAAEAGLGAANCFESVVRAISLEVPGVRLTPQTPIELPEGMVFVDLADPDLRIVVEADSFAFHGTPEALAADARRYNWLVSHGWLLLRITWDVAMHEPELVREWLQAAVQLRTTRRAG